jgi:hypothetical protein
MIFPFNNTDNAVTLHDSISTEPAFFVPAFLMWLMLTCFCALQYVVHLFDGLTRSVANVVKAGTKKDRSLDIESSRLKA